MRAALWLLMLFALAVAFTLLARLDHGYVIVVFPPWRMELSFMLTVALLAACYVLVNLGLRLARTALRLPEDLRAWRQKKRQAAADLALLNALRASLDGDTARVVELLPQAEGCTEHDLLARLGKTLPSQTPAQAAAD